MMRAATRHYASAPSRRWPCWPRPCSSGVRARPRARAAATMLEPRPQGRYRNLPGLLPEIAAHAGRIRRDLERVERDESAPDRRDRNWPCCCSTATSRRPTAPRLRCPAARRRPGRGRLDPRGPRDRPGHGRRRSSSGAVLRDDRPRPRPAPRCVAPWRASAGRRRGPGTRGRPPWSQALLDEDRRTVPAVARTARPGACRDPGTASQERSAPTRDTTDDAIDRRGGPGRSPGRRTTSRGSRVAMIEAQPEASLVLLRELERMRRSAGRRWSSSRGVSPAASTEPTIGPSTPGDGRRRPGRPG